MQVLFLLICFFFFKETDEEDKRVKPQVGSGLEHSRECVV